MQLKGPGLKEMELFTDMFRSAWDKCAIQLIKITHLPTALQEADIPKQPVQGEPEQRGAN